MAPAITAGTFDAVVTEYRLELVSYARRLVGPDDAEDVVQAALERTWAALQDGQVINHAPAWLYLVTRRLALNLWATRRRRPSRALWDSDLADRRGDVELEVERRDEARRMLQAIAALPRRQREELELELAGRQETQSGGDRMSVYRGRLAVRRSVRPAPTMGGA